MTWTDGVVIVVLIVGAVAGFLASRKDDMADRAFPYFLVVFSAHLFALVSVVNLMDMGGEWEYCRTQLLWYRSIGLPEPYDIPGCREGKGIDEALIFIVIILLFVLRFRETSLLKRAELGFTWRMPDWLNRYGSILLAVGIAWIFYSVILNCVWTVNTAMGAAATTFLVNLKGIPGYVVIAILVGGYGGLVIRGQLAGRYASVTDVVPYDIDSFSLHKYYERKAREEQDGQAQSPAEPGEESDHPSGVF